ncbi:uncharacterized protein LOC107362849 [Tetranychus urticae]|nr:uncharacterized protein LOC107362849 [Tetranychus urticae]
MSSKKMSSWRRFVDFVGLMKLDLCLLLFGIANNLQNVTVVQLAEDKKCINDLHLPAKYCLSVTEKHSTGENAYMIVVHAYYIKYWQFYITDIPGTIVAAFLGCWLDKYPHHLKFMVLIALCANTLQSIILLVNAYLFSLSSYFILITYVPFALGGGMFLIYGACYTYVAWSTPPKLLIVRFAIMEFVSMSAGFIGTYISRQVLMMKPWVGGQARNYIGLLSLSTILLLIAMLLASIFKLKNMPVATSEKYRNKFSNVFSPFFKTRPNAGRARLLLLVLSGILCLGAFHGKETYGLRYAELIYGWSAQKYSTMHSLLSIIPALATSLGPFVLKTCLGLSDPIIGILGSLSVVAMNFIHGVVLTPYGFTFTYIAGALHRISIAAFFSLIANMIDSNEVAKIFTMITIFASYGASFSAFMYKVTLSLTIKSNPGLTFIIAAIILIIPVATCVWLEVTRSKWEPKVSTEKDNIYGEKSLPNNATNTNLHSPKVGWVKMEIISIANDSNKSSS